MTRVGNRLLGIVRPRRDRRGDEEGHCSACGAAGRFVLNTWLLPPDAEAEWSDWTSEFARRETLICKHCSATLRVRRLAEVLLEHYAVRASSLRELVGELGFRALDIAEINAVGALHQFLQRLPRLRYSEYGDAKAPDEDLTRLSYADAALDLVLSSDTLEHVRDWRRAIAETRRVLRRDGRHIFTVPLVPERPITEDVAARGWYHARGTGPFGLVPRRPDMLVRTEFGHDLVDVLRQEGFDPELHFAGEVASVLCARAV